MFKLTYNYFPKAGEKYFSTVRIMWLPCTNSWVDLCHVQFLFNCKYNMGTFIINVGGGLLWTTDVNRNALRRLGKDRVGVQIYKWIKYVLMEPEADKHFLLWRRSSHWKGKSCGGKNVPADQDQPQRQTGNTVLWKNAHCLFVTYVTALFFVSYVKWLNFSFYLLQIKRTWCFYFPVAC